jgi:hypothetical protein
MARRLYVARSEISLLCANGVKSRRGLEYTFDHRMELVHAMALEVFVKGCKSLRDNGAPIKHTIC